MDRINLMKLAVCVCTLIALASCSIVRPYEIKALAEAPFPPTDTVTVIREKPADKDYLILAEFVGREPLSCPEGLDLCLLREKARAAGAHAVWIQKHTVRHYNGDWMYLNGRMTRIYPATHETYQGVFIRYAAR